MLKIMFEIIIRNDPYIASWNQSSMRNQIFVMMEKFMIKVLRIKLFQLPWELGERKENEIILKKLKKYKIR